MSRSATILALLALGSSASCSREVLGPSTGPASLVITNATVGGALDPDGYQVSVDQTQRGELELNAGMKLANLPAGEHTVELRGVANNCVVDDGSSQTIELPAGGTVNLFFKITCTPPAELRSLRLVFARDDGLYAMSADGSGFTQLALGEFADLAVSPDGQWIAFSRSGNVHVIRRDGSDLRQVTAFGGWNPAWSPDGTRLVYGGPGGGLSISALAGGNPVRLTNSGLDVDDEPVWSPDGSRIAFSHWDGTGSTPGVIWLVNADGTGETQLGLRERLVAWGPTWSPDGQRIAFLGQRDDNLRPGIFTMAGDGSDLIELYSEEPTHLIGGPLDWSPDGRWLALTRTPKTNQRLDIYLLGADGTLVRVTADRASHWPAFLRP
jgi:hypothetical protein